MTRPGCCSPGVMTTSVDRYAMAVKKAEPDRAALEAGQPRQAGFGSPQPVMDRMDVADEQFPGLGVYPALGAADQLDAEAALEQDHERCACQGQLIETTDVSTDIHTRPVGV